VGGRRAGYPDNDTIVNKHDLRQGMKYEHQEHECFNSYVSLCEYKLSTKYRQRAHQDADPKAISSPASVRTHFRGSSYMIDSNSISEAQHKRVKDSARWLPRRRRTGKVAAQ
jgi:hypothetical protein